MRIKELEPYQKPQKQDKIMDSSIITFKGQKPGKTVTLMGRVHGNETCGPIALRELIKEIQDNKL